MKCTEFPPYSVEAPTPETLANPAPAVATGRRCTSGHALGYRSAMPVRWAMPVRSARRRRAGRVAVVVAALLALVGCTGSPTNTPTASSSESAPAVRSTNSADRPTTASVAAPSVPSRTTGPGPRPTDSPSPAATTSARSTAATKATPGSGTASGSCADPCYRIGAIHQLPAGVAPESSGIAASAAVPGVFFVVDDGTGTDEIEAVRSDGSLVARIRIAGMSARNAEALSAGPCGSRPGRCLYVGDIGDNNAVRRSITVYRVDEPALSPPPRGALAADAWQYTYPDGPHNAEAMVVTPDGSLLILTKSAPAGGEVPPHRIYRAPAGGGRLEYLSSYRPPNPAVPAQSLFTGTVVTDASSTAGRMLLLTYDEVIEYRAPKPGADPATFPSWPHAELPAPAMIQSEGITADLTGCGYEVTSEEGPDGSRAGLAGVSCG